MTAPAGNENTLRESVVALGASLFARGFSVGSAGNISVRSGDGFLMTPTNSSLGRLDPQALSELDAQWVHTAGPKPSKEVVMHQAMYQARPQAAAVVHLHSTYVTAISCLDEEQPIPPLTPYFIMRLGRDVPTVPYYKPGSPAVLDDILAAGQRGPAVILANHGSIVAGSSLEDAVNAAEELEVSAQLAFLLEGRATRPLNEEQIQDLLG
ncbi:3-oxo-tetronate 4-phosphate decarboxylase [Nesterenkonia sandarakina]|uniref:3-oxo-tetronate 4-phosphate decarboxylase n=1 Tax=Nesterenkonia sandarakina TaxID=272918 RepID=A0A2T0YQE4_9MICC|nr:aldolase [Nesterenkonia sandarakina]PRZ17588.1 ribulose-5-phosphate 4-epimerase/fuculose-1-phosphate aldolase [Nesterenkonia sandarakina]